MSMRVALHGMNNEQRTNSVRSFPISPNKVTEDLAGDLGRIGNAGCDLASEGFKRAVAPDRPPRKSARGLRDGTLCRGATGQTFEVRNGEWVRPFI
jgi:hypothetical protein